MQSSGGITALATAAEQPVRTVLSGPAGGIVGAAAVAQRSGFDRIITFDMGGTSSDVALIDGQPTTTNEADVAGLPVRVPVLDIHTVGAGGGSLARFDAGGALRVGPESAGADPGPICYGKGERPTVTDANLLLGRLACRPVSWRRLSTRPAAHAKDRCSNGSRKITAISRRKSLPPAWCAW